MVFFRVSQMVEIGLAREGRRILGPTSLRGAKPLSNYDMARRSIVHASERKRDSAGARALVGMHSSAAPHDVPEVFEDISSSLDFLNGRSLHPCRVRNCTLIGTPSFECDTSQPGAASHVRSSRTSPPSPRVDPSL